MRRLAAAVFAVLMGGTSGCTIVADDEMTPPPSPSATATPGTQGAPMPDSVPVGRAGIARTTPVWAQGSVLHVGDRTLDIAPRRVDAFVVTPGGIYFIDSSEVWFTDLDRVRGTALESVTGIVANADRSRIRVTAAGQGGATGVQGYETRQGKAVPAATVRPVPVEERLGRRIKVELRSADGDASTPRGSLAARVGPGDYGLIDVDAGPLMAFEAASRHRVPLAGVTGTGFELVRWTGPTTFYGVALSNGSPTGVLGCDLTTRQCRTWGSTGSDGGLIFESGS